MFGYTIIKKEKLEDMNYLISCLSSFIFVAKTDNRPSKAVSYVYEKFIEYKERWG